MNLVWGENSVGLGEWKGWFFPLDFKEYITSVFPGMNGKIELGYICVCCWKRCSLWPVHFLDKTLLLFALLHSVFQGQICLLLQVFLDFLLLHSRPLQWKEHLFWVLVLKGLVGLHRTIQLQLLQVTGWGTDLDYCDIEWFALETNRDHSVIF